MFLRNSVFSITHEEAHGNILILLMLLLCLTPVSLFAQDNPFIGDWYRTDYDTARHCQCKEIFRISSPKVDVYLLRSKTVRADNGELLYYGGEYVYVPSESDSSSIVFYHETGYTEPEEFYSNRSFYKFTPSGDVAYWHMYKSFIKGKNCWDKYKGYHEEWNYYPTGAQQLYRVDDF